MVREVHLLKSTHHDMLMRLMAKKIRPKIPKGALNQQAVMMLAAAARMLGDPLQDPQHERFCAEFAKGLHSAAWCYKFVYNCDESSSYSGAWQLMRNNEIGERIAEIQRVATQVSALEDGEMLSWLRRLVRAAPLDVDEASPFVQSFVRARKVVGEGEEAEEWEYHKIRLVDKLPAARLLAEMERMLPDPHLTIDHRVAVLSIDATREAIATSCQCSPVYRETHLALMAQVIEESGEEPELVVTGKDGRRRKCVWVDA